MKKLIIPLVIILTLCGACGFFSFVTYSAFKKGDYSKLSSVVSVFNGKQEDLGIISKQDDATTFLSKNKLVATNTCPTGKTCTAAKPTYIGTATVDTQLTNSEGTALINQWIALSKNAPFSSAQMRVNADGSVDFSSTVDLTRLRNFATQSNVPAETADMALKYIGALGNSFPMSAHGTLTIKNGVVNSQFSSVKVGFISVPASIFTDNKAEIDSFITDRLANVPSLKVTELSFAGGKTTFKGQLPQTIVFVK